MITAPLKLKFLNLNLMISINFLENHIWLSHALQVFICCVVIGDLVLSTVNKGVTP